jgi:uncharacterized protein YdaT
MFTQQTRNIDMPWTIKDVDKFNKNLTPQQKLRWISIANNIYEKCKKTKNIGTVSKSCEEKAIRIANYMIKNEKSD